MGFHILHKRSLPYRWDAITSTGTVSEPYQMVIHLALLRLAAERKQAPHIVEKPRDWMELREALEPVRIAYKLEVRGSSPRPPTISIRVQEGTEYNSA